MWISVSSGEQSVSPVAWSLGYCPGCKQDGLVQIYEVFEGASINGLIPVSRTYQGEAAQCHWCGNWVEVVHDLKGVSLAKWTPGVPLSDLVEKLNPVARQCSLDYSRDERLHRLLRIVEKASSFRHQEMGVAGLLIGAMAGGVIGFAFGIVACETELIVPQNMDTFKVVVGSLIPSGVAGLILGGIIQTVLNRTATAFHRIEEAYRTYDLDLDHLQALAATYSRRIRRAVDRVRRLRQQSKAD